MHSPSPHFYSTKTVPTAQKLPFPSMQVSTNPSQVCSDCTSPVCSDPAHDDFALHAEWSDESSDCVGDGPHRDGQDDREDRDDPEDPDDRQNGMQLEKSKERTTISNADVTELKQQHLDQEDDDDEEEFTDDTLEKDQKEAEFNNGEDSDTDEDEEEEMPRELPSTIIRNYFKKDVNHISSNDNIVRNNGKVNCTPTDIPPLTAVSSTQSAPGIKVQSIPITVIENDNETENIKQTGKKKNKRSRGPCRAAMERRAETTAITLPEQ